MTDEELKKKIDSLPDDIKKQVHHYVDFLIEKEKNKHDKNRNPKFGSAKGLIVIKDDFDEPLEDFKEYM